MYLKEDIVTCMLIPPCSLRIGSATECESLPNKRMISSCCKYSPGTKGVCLAVSAAIIFFVFERENSDVPLLESLGGFLHLDKLKALCHTVVIYKVPAWLDP